MKNSATKYRNTKPLLSAFPWKELPSIILLAMPITVAISTIVARNQLTKG